MKSIYHHDKDKQAVLDLYDAQLKRLSIPYKDREVMTTFGKTHLIETGNLKGKPLLLFHGGNATTAYNLLYCDFLLQDFHIYAVDTIGHPGKSAEQVLSARNQEYGQWASEVISALDYEQMTCFGGSYGGGVLVKLLCVAPEKVERAVLLVPAALRNAHPIKSMSMFLPMVMYWITHQEKWFVKCILPMALTQEHISKDILETARCSIDHAKIKVGMPKNERITALSNYAHPVLVMAAEKDCLFPGNRVLARAQEAWPQSQTWLLKERGHIHELTAKEKEWILSFLHGETILLE